MDETTETEERYHTAELMNGWRRVFAETGILRRSDFRFHFSGSRILSPAEIQADTDLDIVLWVHDNNLPETLYLLENDWGMTVDSLSTYSTLDNGGFVSYRSSGLINISLTTNAGFYRKHQLATELGSRLGLVGKPARVKWFRKVLYGESMR